MVSDHLLSNLLDTCQFPVINFLKESYVKSILKQIRVVTLNINKSIFQLFREPADNALYIHTSPKIDQE